MKTIKRVMAAVAWTVVLGASAQERSLDGKLLAPQRLDQWNIPAADYSGITSLGGGRYAVVSDKQDAFFIWRIRQDSLSGEVLQVEQEGSFLLSGLPENERQLDLEGITSSADGKYLFLASERFQKIYKVRMDGELVSEGWLPSKGLSPEEIWPNYGFESLTRTPGTDSLWFATENGLKNYGPPSGRKHRVPAMIPILVSDTSRQVSRYLYMTDPPHARSKKGKGYCFGISEMLALDSQRILVLEREFLISPLYWKSWCHHKIYWVDPNHVDRTDSPYPVLSKKKLLSFKTRLNPMSYQLANYEGMCLGDTLSDGSQTVLLLSDSQSGAGNKLYRLKDYIRVIVLHEKE